MWRGWSCGSCDAALAWRGVCRCPRWKVRLGWTCVQGVRRSVTRVGRVQMVVVQVQHNKRGFRQLHSSPQQTWGCCGR